MWHVHVQGVHCITQPTRGLALLCRHYGEEPWNSQQSLDEHTQQHSTVGSQNTWPTRKGLLNSHQTIRRSGTQEQPVTTRPQLALRWTDLHVHVHRVLLSWPASTGLSLCQLHCDTGSSFQSVNAGPSLS